MTTVHFDSWNESIEIAADASLTRWTLKSSRTGSLDFTGTETWDEALDLARYGWPKGRARLHNLISEAATARQPSVAPALSYDVAGAYPNAALAAAGDPACMVTPYQDEAAARPIVRLAVNFGARSSTKTKTIENYGAAVLAYIDRAEAGGVSVELLMTSCNEITDLTYNIHTVLKRAGEPLELDRLAFAIGHPSSLRRIKFAHLEQSPRKHQHSGYGYPKPDRPADLDHDQIFITGLINGKGLDSLAAAMVTIDARILAEQDRIRQ